MLKEKIASMILPGIVSLAVSGITAAGNMGIMTERMNARIAVLEKESARHELTKEKDFSRIRLSTDDHEKRLVRLETNLGAMQNILNEVRADIKELLNNRAGLRR